jgi:hypothetical protein
MAVLSVRATRSAAASSDFDRLSAGENGFGLPVPNASHETVRPSWETGLLSRKGRADLVRNRRFESISLQQTVRLSPAATFERQEPGLSPRVCEARLTTGSAETQQAFHCAPAGGNVSAGPYSSTAVPLMRSTKMPRRSRQSCVFSAVERAWVFEFGSGSSKTEQGPLVVPGKRQNVSARGASLPSNRAAAAHRGWPE